MDGYLTHLLIASARRGHERAVLRDLLDALFPYDHGIKGAICGWNICVETSLNLEELQRFLRSFPIRNLLSVRYVLAMLELKDLGELTRRLPEVLEYAGLKARKLRIRLSSRSGWSQEYFATVKKALLEKSLLDQRGWLIAVEERGRKIMVSILLKP